MLRTKTETTYKSFIVFKSDFEAEALESASFTDADSFGIEFRPVVVVSEEKFQYWAGKIKEWETYASTLLEADPKRYPTTSKDIYPLPLLFTNVRAARVYTYKAVDSKTVTREKLFSMLNYALSRAIKTGDTTLHAAIAADLERFGKYDPEAKFRIRHEGFSDMMMNIYFHENSEPQKIHVPSHGVFIREKDLDRSGVTNGDENPGFSIYSEINPIPCAAFINKKIYDLETLEAATRDYQENIRDVRRAEKKHKSYKARLTRAKNDNDQA